MKGVLDKANALNGRRREACDEISWVMRLLNWHKIFPSGNQQFPEFERSIFSKGFPSFIPGALDTV